MSDEKRLPYDRLAQLVDRAEEQGGFPVVNYQIEVDDERLSLIDTIRFREIMMSRQRSREEDKSSDYQVARQQGYRAALNDLELSVASSLQDLRQRTYREERPA